MRPSCVCLSISQLVFSLATQTHWTAALVARGVAKQSPNPVSQVITLLENLRNDVEREGQQEAAAYDTFSCFCKDATKSKSQSISSLQSQVDTLSASIQADAATRDSKSAELGECQAKQGELESSLKDTTNRCQMEAAQFDANVADLTKAVSMLDTAIKSLQASKPVAGLLVVKSELSKAQAMLAAAVMGIKDPKRRALLQHGVDPADPEYKFHSQGILDTLTGLLKEFTENKKDAEDERDKANTACGAEKASLTTLMGSNQVAIQSLGSEIDTLKGNIANARESLVETESLLEDDQLYLKDVTTRCESRAKTWDQRSSLRAGEIKALTEALTILAGEVESRDALVNKRAMLVQHLNPTARKPELAVHSFLQTALQHSQVAGQVASVRQQKVRDVLDLEATRLQSPVFAVLAQHLMEEPFAEVKRLVQQLIERLLKESTDEATKKGFCDEALGRATKDRDFRYADTIKLTAELSSHEAKSERLIGEVATLKSDASATSTRLAEAVAQREKDKAANLETIKTAKEGVSAVSNAIVILKDFYKAAGKAMVLVEASPVDAADPGAGFEGAYAGKQSSSAGILALLDVIKSDFERTIQTAERDEKKAAADFVDFERASKVSISEKTRGAKLDEEELATLAAVIERKYGDLESNQGLVDAALKAIEGLKPMCIDNTMTFQVRTQKRDEEIAALKKALCYLDPAQKETECQ